MGNLGTNPFADKLENIVYQLEDIKDTMHDLRNKTSYGNIYCECSCHDDYQCESGVYIQKDENDAALGEWVDVVAYETEMAANVALSEAAILLKTFRV